MRHKHSSPEKRGRDIAYFAEETRKLFEAQLNDLAKIKKLDLNDPETRKYYLLIFLKEFKNVNPRYRDVIEKWISLGEIKDD